jgi:hypothetical protein
VASTCCQIGKDDLIDTQTGEDSNTSPTYSAVLRRNNRKNADSISLNGFYSVSVDPSECPIKETKDDSGV